MNQDNNTTQQPQAPKTVPFEDNGKTYLQGTLDTLKLALLRPAEFFKNYKMSGPVVRSTMFAVLIGWTAAAVNIIYGSLLHGGLIANLRNVMEQMGKNPQDHPLVNMVMTNPKGFMLFSFFLQPIVIVATTVILAGACHFFLNLTGGANKKFDTTYNVIAYCAAARALEIIPLYGGILSMVFGISMAVKGITAAHQTSQGKAVAAVLGPIVMGFFLLMMVLGSIAR